MLENALFVHAFGYMFKLTNTYSYIKGVICSYTAIHVLAKLQCMSYLVAWISYIGIQLTMCLSII